MKGKGRKMATPIRLNNKWQIAMAMAASDLNEAAIRAVMVVPILAPITNGKAFLSDSLPVAARGTINVVVIELD